MDEKLKKPHNAILGAWQIVNCKGCRYSTSHTVGTGLPCCNFYQEIKTNSKGNCLSKRG